MRTILQKYNAVLMVVFVVVLATFLATPALAAEIWIPTDSMENRRMEHPSVLLNSGNVLTTGSLAGGTTILSAAELYDPNTGTWTPTGSMLEPRYHHTLTLLQGGKVLATGGGAPGSSFSGTTSAEIYDSSTGIWSKVAAMSKFRTRHTATLLVDGRVLIVGGIGSFNFPASAEIYDPSTNTWTSTGPMIGTNRADHTATMLSDGKVLVAGGSNGPNPSLSTAELYDPNTNTWTATGSMIVGRGSHTASFLSDGKVLVIGGVTTFPTRTATVEIYDPLTGVWSTTTSMNNARSGHTSTVFPNGHILVAGGGGHALVGGSTILSLVEEFDPSSSTWTQVNAMIARRVAHSANLLANGMVLVAGGSGSGGVLSSSELYGEFNDFTPPAANPSQSPEANIEGWNNSDVIVDWNWTDTGGTSINPNVCTMESMSAGEGILLTLNATCIDYAGNTGTASYVVKVDKTPPTLGGATTTSSNSNGWYNGNVTIVWTCGDALSGLSGDCPADSIITDEGVNLSVTTSINDFADNIATTTVSYINIDRTTPNITASATNADGSSYIAGTETNQVVTVHFTCTDDLSGVAACTSDQVVNTGGVTPSVNGTAADNAGNIANVSFGPIHIVNRVPVLALIGDKAINESTNLEFTITATDPDDDNLVYSASNLPSGASFDAQTATFAWTPTFQQAGVYADVVFIVMDDGTPVASTNEAITITVNDINQAPALHSVGNKSVDEGELLQFVVTATDPDNDNLTFSALNLPSGATFDSETRIFSWTPIFTQAGMYTNIEFTVTDDGGPMLSDSETITIIVNDVAPLELTTTADSFLRAGQANRNEGANPHLFIQSSGNNRTVVAFDSAAIANYVASHGITSATLIFTIADNGDNWGSTGRTVDAHPLLTTFAEGNGKDAEVPGSESTRGEGAGTTWNCATDTAIENQTTNCNPEWNGGTYGTATAAPVTHTNGQSGEVSWDVTADVLSSATGWLIRKTNESQNGKMEYYSREGAATAGNIILAPRLVLVP